MASIRCSHLLAGLLVALAACSTGRTAEAPGAPVHEAPSPTETPEPTEPPSDGALLEAAQFALVAHSLSSELDPDVATQVGAYGMLVAIELGISDELRAAGRLGEARTLREHAYTRALTLRRAEALRETVPASWFLVTDPPGGWLLAPDAEASRARARVDALSERAFLDVAPTAAPTIDEVIAAVERYTRPLDGDRH